ncbi:MAG: DUF4011 domain-containing protein [Bacilli bacterium]
MNNEKFNITANVSDSISYISRQCEIYLCDKYHDFTNSNCFSFLRSVRIQNMSSSDVLDSTLKIEFDAPEIKDSLIHISCLDKDKIVEITNNLNFKIDPAALYSLTEAKLVNVSFSLFNKDNELLVSRVYPLHLLPLEQLSLPNKSASFLSEMLSCFVTPNDDYVIELAGKATKILYEDEKNSFLGYQANDPNYVVKQLNAIYKAVRNEGIAYMTPPASFEKIFQRVRLPQNVLKTKQGTCLDLAILMASVIEHVGIHPVVFLLNKHAFVGAWLEDGLSANTSEENSTVFTESSEKGIGKFICIEATVVCSGQAGSFNDATEVGRNNLYKYIFNCGIDIEECRKTEIYKPIPTPNKKGDTEIHFDVVDLMDEKPNEVDTSARGKFVTKDKDKDKFNYWERKLLDLSLNNRLINIKIKKNVLNVLLTQPKDFLEAIVKKDKFNLCGYSSKESLLNTTVMSYKDKDFINSSLRKGEIIIETDALRFDDEIKKLSRRSLTAYEESGSNILFLAFGLIEWYPTTNATYPNYAPLILIPIQLSSRKVGNFYNVDFAVENARLNITFLEYVKQNYHLDVDINTDDLPVDDQGVIEYDEICNTLTRELNLKNWKVIKDKAYIDTFSFSHFVMWEDIYNRKEELLKNDVVASLYYGVNKCPNNDEENLQIDSEIKPNDLSIPLSADSSQVEAIVSCAKGNSFVMFGPPGTGKSQTIANMIVNLMYHGKSVLFVAEKMVALEVVKHRLDEIGLGNFCLQIHSNKISKSEVLTQIDNSLNVGKIEEPKDGSINATKLLEERSLLNDKLDKMHSNKKYFISLYDAILRYETLKNDAKDKHIDVSENYINGLTKESFKESIDAINSLVIASKEVGGFKDNPFILYEGKEYNLNVRNEIEKKIDEAYKRIDSFNKDYVKFSKDNLLTSIDTIKETIDINLVLDFLRKNDGINFDNLLSFDYVLKDRLCNDYLDERINEYSYKEQITRRFGHNIFDINSEMLLENLKVANKFNFFKRYMVRRRVNKTLSAYLLASENKIKNNELEDILEKVISYKKAKMRNENVDRAVYYHFSAFECKTANEYNDLKNNFNTTRKFLSLVKDTAFYNEKDIKSIKKIYQNKDYLFSNDINKTIAQNNEFLSYLRELKAEDNINFIDNNLTFSDMLKNIQKFKKNIEKFNLWILLLKAIGECQKLNLDFLVDEYKAGNVQDTDLVLTYTYSIYLKVISLYFNVIDFNDFTKPEIEKNIASYKDLIDQYSKITIETAASKITKNLQTINSKYITSTEFSQLKRLVKSNGKGTSLRLIMSNLGGFVKKICPCFLMSPLSIAQYIDPEKNHFDVVIFDEASQIPTSEAIGAIARGDSVVIAGDPNQMPPTNFFKTQINDDGDFFSSVDDLDSLLDDCLAIGLPEKHLLWHYRSHHESLIAFSNNKFYHNDLFTFPSPSNLNSNVHFINVHGTYERNKGINVVEANAIVNEIIRRVKDPILSTKSIGVVTFNQKQQNLIEDLIDKEYDKDPNINLRPGGESIFIKNLENVQGDERDVILFSICFAKRKDGELSLNFGPLSLEKGERRLNVAVSRARDEMIVFSSIEPIDINPNNAKNDGARYLRDLLEYAKYGTKTLTKNVDNNDKEIDVSVANFIKSDLEKLGYKCDLNVGSSNFRIDIAIKDKEEKSYVLGVICDSSYYFDAKTCRDRNVLHSDVLKRLGWNIIRIWTIDYYDHPNEVVNSIVERIKYININGSSSTGNNLKKRTPLKDEIYFKKTDEEAWMKNAVAYAQYNDLLSNINDDRQVLYVLKKLIETEAPLNYLYIKERLRKLALVTKIGPKANARILSLLGELHYYHTNGPDTYWLNQEQYLGYKTYRKHKDFDIMNVPYEELGNLFIDILNDVKKIKTEDLFKFVSTFYGYSAMKEKTKKYLSDALHYLVFLKYKGIYQSGDLISIKK